MKNLKEELDEYFEIQAKKMYNEKYEHTFTGFFICLLTSVIIFCVYTWILLYLDKQDFIQLNSKSSGTRLSLLLIIMLFVNIAVSDVYVKKYLKNKNPFSEFKTKSLLLKIRKNFLTQEIVRVNDKINYLKKLTDENLEDRLQQLEELGKEFQLT